MNIPNFIKEFISKILNKNGVINYARTKQFMTPTIISWLEENKLNINQVKYLLDNNLTEIPVCRHCGNQLTKFENNIHYCSIQCFNNSNERKEKYKKTCLEKYGSENPNQSKEIMNKRKETCLKKYGTGYPFQSNLVKEKIKETNLERYDTKYPAQNQEIKEKIRKTTLSKEFEEKRKKTNLEKYGTEYATQSEIIKEKSKQTCLERYSTENPFKSKEIRDKIENICLEKYGTRYPAQNQEIKEKISQHLKQVMGTTIVQEKIKKTCLERYGVEYSSQIPEAIEKRNKTNKSKYFNKLVEMLKNKNISLEMAKEEFIKNNTYTYKCLSCGNVFVLNISNAQKIHCSNCLTISSSMQEKEMLGWIKSIYSGNIIENDRTIIKPYELDIYIPEKKLAIEYNGNYWHSTLFVDKKYHQEKTLLCRERGIRLIHIFEYEWINKQEICKSIIKSALGIYDKRIYARKCNVKSISSSDYRDFLDENHLQGSINSSIRYGLFYQDELIAVIGFGKSRFKKGEIELHRFCTKLGYQIMGGFSKLIKHSNISSFITYVDLAHFSGDGYKQIGFEELSITEPNYKWIKNNIVLNRFSTQKHKLKDLLENYDDNLTEIENMDLNGFNQIYDSGNLKIIFNCAS